MGTSELDTPGPSGEEHAPAASSETPRRTEQPGRSAGRTQGPSDTGSTSAGTLTREEYGDSMRAQGPPVPPGDTPAHAQDTQEPRDAPAEEPPRRSDTADAAEPRDRDAYADEIRAGSGDPIPGSRDAAESRDAKPPGDPLETGTGTPDAEPRTRDGYAGDIRENPPGDTSQLADAAADSAAPTWAGSDNGQASSETAAPEPPERSPAGDVPDTGSSLGASPGPLGDSPVEGTAPDSPLPEQPAGYTGAPGSDPGRTAPDTDLGDGPGSLEDAAGIAAAVLPGEPAQDSAIPGPPPPGSDAAQAAAQPPDQGTSPDTGPGTGDPPGAGQDEMPGHASAPAGDLSSPRAEIVAAAEDPRHPQDIPPPGDLRPDSAPARGLADGQPTAGPPSPAFDRGTVNAIAGLETTRPTSDETQPGASDMTPASDKPGRPAHDTSGHPGPGGHGEPGADTSGQPGQAPRDGSELTSAATGQDSTTDHAGREMAYVEGREIEITHNRADGLWVSGLPGELPNAPYGDPFGTARAGEVIASNEKNETARAERLISKFCERADDILDITEKDLNEAQDIFSPRPTHTEVPVQVTHYTPVTPYHEIDAGSMATALMALGVAAWGVHHWWQQKREASSGPEESADDSHR